jgi:sigma-E factor negative regulatory protein RseA
MNEQISELMDGELDDEMATRLFGALKSSDAVQDWQTYHLIGDALRATPSLSPDFMERFSARLADEPTVLAPRRAHKRAPRLIALSAAASLTAVGLVVWAVLHTGAPNAPNELLVAKAPQVMLTSASVNPYLLAHQEYSPSIAMEGAGSYVGTAPEIREVAAR